MFCLISHLPPQFDNPLKFVVASCALQLPMAGDRVEFESPNNFLRRPTSAAPKTKQSWISSHSKLSYLQEETRHISQQTYWTMLLD